MAQASISGKRSSSGQAAVLVIGGGIGGMRSALDMADAGLKVFLVEQTPYLGGRVAQLGFMFPQHDCVLCRGTHDHGYGCTRPSISPAYIQHNQHPNIEILTNTSVTGIEGQAGNFTVALRQEPSYIDAQRCVDCGYCAEVCPVELPNQHQQGITLRKAAYKVSARAAPNTYVINRGPYCDGCGKCVEVCLTNAIDLNQKPQLLSIEVGAIVLALGFQMFDAGQVEEYGYGRFPNVLNAMEYERLASRSGPTEGIVIRPSNQKKPRSIAWLQCVGSRDQDHPFCSSICCMYATKEAVLAKQRLGNEVHCRIFVMDVRAFNKQYNKYFSNARLTHGVQYTHCRVSAIQEDPQTGDLILSYADPNGVTREERFEMVVLATGLQPPRSAASLLKLLKIEVNEYGFCQTDKFTPMQTTRPGVFVCGAFSSPKEIVETIIDASGAAAEVIRLMNETLNADSYTQAWPFLTSEDFPPEMDVSAEPPAVGVFACSCGGSISEVIDLNRLARQAARLNNVLFAEVLELACIPESIEYIRSKILSSGVNRIVVAGCSNRTHDPLFQKVACQAGINPYMVELVNIREQCARPHRWQVDLGNRKAFELVRVAVGRVSASVPVHKEFHRCRPNALVIGGGVSGMTAALAIADSGHDVNLVERSGALGGNLLNLYYVAEGYNPQRLLRDLVNRVRSHQRIHVHTRTEVARHNGHVGFFQTLLRTRMHNGEIEETNIEHGVTIVATGGREAKSHPWLELPGVITQLELEDKLIHQPEEFAALRDVVMIQCVRPEGASDYCSRVCCTNTMKNAIRIKLFNPKCQVSVLYKNIVTYGFREAYYTEARRLGVIFARYTDENPPQIIEDGDRLKVIVHDIALDRPIEIPADVVPLSMPILPADGAKDLARVLRVPLTGEGFFEEAQLKLRPMDFMREGIFLAGMAHYPKFVEESISHALAASARALTLISRERLYLGGVVAQVDPEKCVGCLTCTRTCPFGIPQVVQEAERKGVGALGGAAYIDSAQCQGCGTCTADCPANAIQLVNFTDKQVMLTEIAGLGSWAPLAQEG
jgi:heterodisulfide reductase subunit A2